MFTDVHAQGASTTAKAVALGAKLAAIALLAPEGIVMGVDIGGVQALVAEVALEAHLVPLVATSQQLLGGVDGLVAAKADVRHFGLKVRKSGVLDHHLLSVRTLFLSKVFKRST